MNPKLKLAQGQVWQQGDVYFRIVKWTRLTIDYKAMKNLASKEGEMHAVSKKAFCRLIKGARLLTPELLSEVQAQHLEALGSKRDEGVVPIAETAPAGADEI